MRWFILLIAFVGLLLGQKGFSQSSDDYQRRVDSLDILQNKSVPELARMSFKDVPSGELAFKIIQAFLIDEYGPEFGPYYYMTYGGIKAFTSEKLESLECRSSYYNIVSINERQAFKSFDTYKESDQIMQENLNSEFLVASKGGLWGADGANIASGTYSACEKKFGGVVHIGLIFINQYELLPKKGMSWQEFKSTRLSQSQWWKELDKQQFVLEYKRTEYHRLKRTASDTLIRTENKPVQMFLKDEWDWVLLSLQNDLPPTWVARYAGPPKIRKSALEGAFADYEKLEEYKPDFTKFRTGVELRKAKSQASIRKYNDEQSGKRKDVLVKKDVFEQTCFTDLGAVASKIPTEQKIQADNTAIQTNLNEFITLKVEKTLGPRYDCMPIRIRRGKLLTEIERQRLSLLQAKLDLSNFKQGFDRCVLMVKEPENSNRTSSWINYIKPITERLQRSSLSSDRYREKLDEQYATAQQFAVNIGCSQ